MKDAREMEPRERIVLAEVERRGGPDEYVLAYANGPHRPVYRAEGEPQATTMHLSKAKRFSTPEEAFAARLPGGLPGDDNVAGYRVEPTEGRQTYRIVAERTGIGGAVAITVEGPDEDTFSYLFDVVGKDGEFKVRSIRHVPDCHKKLFKNDFNERGALTMRTEG